MAIVPAWAQQQQPDDDGYAPEHGVARVSLVNGEVSVRRGDSGELTAAAPNGPLVVNDHLATGPSGRAEIQFDWGNSIRLAQNTEVRLGELEDRRFLVQIATGTTTFSVLRDSGADVEISTPTVSIRPVQQGDYRVSVFPDGTTEITVRSGRAEIFSPRGTETLTAGSTMEARGSPSDPEYMINAAIPQDEWDRWNVDRDRALDRTSSYRYVNPDIVGAEDLDPYGRWVYDPQYGNVWVPTVDSGWAPYRVGRWVDEPFYGWTWVSGDPWGWAPYHYGNWYLGSFGWAWYPGPFGGHHYWRPALVGFFGWGPGFGLSFGFGNVGWVPLAPFERFHPWYGRGFNNTTIVNNITVVNNFRNARFVNGRNGVTSVNANDFSRGRAVNSNNFVRASNNDLARAGSVQGRLPFTASADARRMSDRQVNTQSLPRVSDNTRFAQPRGQGFTGQGRQAQVIGQSAPQASSQAPQSFSRAPSQGFSQSGAVRGNNPAPALVGPGNGGGNGNGNNGNAGAWRRFDPSATRPSAPNVIGGQNNGGQNNSRVAPVPASPAPQNRNFSQPAPQPQPQPQQMQRQYVPQQQPVRVSPPIVRERAPAPQVSRPEPPRGNGGGFGSPRPQGGGGGGGGGGNHGGGGGGGNHGGGDRRR